MNIERPRDDVLPGGYSAHTGYPVRRGTRTENNGLTYQVFFCFFLSVILRLGPFRVLLQITVRVDGARLADELASGEPKIDPNQAIALIGTGNARPSVVQPGALVADDLKMLRPENGKCELMCETTPQLPKTEDEIKEFKFFVTRKPHFLRLSDCPQSFRRNCHCERLSLFHVCNGCTSLLFFGGHSFHLQLQFNLFSLYMRGPFRSTLLSTLSDANIPYVLCHLITTFLNESDP